jgi:arginine exporter protein ArgO
MVKKYVPIEVLPQVCLALLGSVVMASLGLWGQPIWTRSLTTLLFGMLLTAVAYLLTIGLFGWKRVTQEIRSLISK